MPLALRPLVARFACLSAVIALVGASAACSSDPPAGAKYPTSDAFCTARAENECAVSDLCTVKKDACITARKNACVTASSAASTQGRSYDPAGADLCILQLSLSYKADKALIKPDELRQIEAACLKVFTGKVEKNQRCEATTQCVGTLVCDKGFCADPVVKAGDTPCGNPGETCVAGYVCAKGEVSTCVKRKALGELCSGPDTCEESLLCNGSCKKKLEVGDQCLTSADCASTLCDSNIKKCTAGLTFAGGSDVCKQYGG